MTALGSGFGKTVVLASADVALRERLRLILTGMRWNVCEAGGGAEAIAQLEESRAEAMLMDSWLPDLEVGEFTLRVRLMHPDADLLRLDGATVAGVTRSPRRHELLHALRELAEGSPAAASELAAAGAKVREDAPFYLPQSGLDGPEDEEERTIEELARVAAASLLDPVAPYETAAAMSRSAAAQPQAGPDFSVMIPGMIGRSGGMLELARLIRLVAPKRTTVLIEGETGSGKEVVAQALHQLSARARQPFTVLNCAAIPEALLEAELFGHTRGAFTGAVQSRTGRIQAAHEGTLFLDEIGEASGGRDIPAGFVPPPGRVSDRSSSAPRANIRHCRVSGGLPGEAGRGVPEKTSDLRRDAEAGGPFVAGQCTRAGSCAGAGNDPCGWPPADHCGRRAVRGAKNGIAFGVERLHL
jgi:hypothetical protein